MLTRLQSGLPNTMLVTAASAMAGMVSGIILARTLGPSQRGEFAAILLWPSTIAILGELGLTFAFAYHAGKDREAVNGLWTLAWLTAIIWGGLLALSGAMIVPQLLPISSSTRGSVQLAMTTVPVSMITGFLSYLLLGTGRLVEYNAVRAYTGASYALGILGVALAKASSTEIFTLVYVISQASSCVLAIWLSVRCLRPHVDWQPQLISPVFIFAMKTYVSSVAAQTTLRLGQLMMTALVAPVELGYYVVAVAFSTLISPLYTSLAIVTLPRVILAGSLRAQGKESLRYVQMGFIMGVPASGVLILMASWLLSLLFGAEFVQAIRLARLLLVAAIFGGANIILGNCLRGLGRPEKPAIAEGVGMLATVGLLLALLPALGALGAAVASLVAGGLVTLFQLVFVRSTTGLAWKDFWTINWRSLAPGLAIIRRAP